jgi:hypothetical protein
MPAYRLCHCLFFLAALSLLLALSCEGGSSAVDLAPPAGGAATCAPGELSLPDGGCQPVGLPPDMGA